MAFGTCPACGQSMIVGGSCSNCQRIQQKNEMAQRESLNMQRKQLKMQKQSMKSNQGNTSAKTMHWKYFLICGWLVGILAICFIFPLFIKGLVARAFGYW